MSSPLNPGLPCVVCGATPAWSMYGPALCVAHMGQVVEPAQRKDGP